MPHKFHKYKLLLDEGFPPRPNFPRLNSRFDVRHVSVDLNHSGLKDRDVYLLAVKLKRIVVTFNDKDFKDYASSDTGSGVIGISANLSSEQIDKKLTALLVGTKKSKILGKFNYISGETE